MRTVMDSSMVAHVWAQQKQAHARTPSSNLYFNGPRIYSYGSHYLVGLFAAPGGPVFLNADSSTVTTNKHRREAASAVRHLGPWSVPDLNSVADYLARAGRGAMDDSDRAALLRYLSGAWQHFAPDSMAAAWILRKAGKRGTWAALRDRLERAKAKADAANKAKRIAALIRSGRDHAGRPWRDVIESAWVDAAAPHGRALSNDIASLRAERLATPKAHKRIRAALWKQEQALRDITERAAKDAQGYYGAGPRTLARAHLVNLRRLREGRGFGVPGYDGPDGTPRLLAALALETGAGWHMLAEKLSGLASRAHMPPQTRAAMTALCQYAEERAESMKSDKARADDIAKARTACRVAVGNFNAARRSLAYLQSVGTGTPAALCDRLQRVADSAPDATPWNARDGLRYLPTLAARMERVAARAAEIVAAQDEPLRAARIERDREREAQRERDRLEREAIAAMSLEAKRAAWESGTHTARALGIDYGHPGGPLLRAVAPVVRGCAVVSGELETSQGASVPLRHAFRVFQFVALCRAQGKAWTPGAFGPARIRVGHFQVDRISETGDFVAGCHSIQWPEVERLAQSLGVADCLATLPEVTQELAGVAA